MVDPIAMFQVVMDLNSVRMQTTKCEMRRLSNALQRLPQGSKSHFFSCVHIRFLRYQSLALEIDIGCALTNM